MDLPDFRECVRGAVRAELTPFIAATLSAVCDSGGPSAKASTKRAMPSASDIEEYCRDPESSGCDIEMVEAMMAECEKLYGITREKRGVSARIGVSLDQVDRFTEGPSFDKATKRRIAGEESVGF